MAMIDSGFAAHFAANWAEAWNDHDLDAILAFLHDNFEMVSPSIVRIAGVESGRLVGREAVSAYWTKALEMYPKLNLEIVHVLTGIDSIVIYSKIANDRFLAETFYFDNAQSSTPMVVRSISHYTQ
ncbi:MAG: nuclear transport factor 2 family protein [Actinomycetota bacterium]|nr:nuclear transport factor 2 family protein [Actinomycetota bacterium]